MVEAINWEDEAKGLLKAELKKRNLTYAQLTDKLLEMNVVESERNVANKISRGKFTAAFFLQCLKAIGVSNLRIED